MKEADSMNSLHGKKTYLIAVAMIVYSVSSYFLGQENAGFDIRAILEALGLAALRSGVANK